MSVKVLKIDLRENKLKRALHDTSLHSTKRNEEERLPLIVKSKHCYSGIGEGGKYHIQSKNI